MIQEKALKYPNEKKGSKRKEVLLRNSYVWYLLPDIIIICLNLISENFYQQRIVIQNAFVYIWIQENYSYLQNN